MRQEQNRVESLTEHQRGEGASCPEAWAWVPWPEVVTCSLSRVIKGTHTSHSGISDWKLKAFSSFFFFWLLKSEEISDCGS